jgi:hypothetical protein
VRRFSLAALISLGFGAGASPARAAAKNPVPPSYFPLGAISVADGSYASIAHVSDDGAITNSSFKLVGHLEGGGAVTDAGKVPLGTVSGGWIRDTQGKIVGGYNGGGLFAVVGEDLHLVGWVAEDGTIHDSANAKVGHVGAYRPTLLREVATVAWFFSDGKLALK